MTSNAKLGATSDSIVNGNMANTLTTSWQYTLMNQRYSFGSYWTGTPNGTLYVDVGIGIIGNVGYNPANITVYSYTPLSTMVVTSGLTTDNLSQWFVAGFNDWQFIRFRWVPTGTTTGTMVNVLGTFKSLG